MRALGPGSVSSLLKIALDVAFFLLWIVLGALVLALISSFFVPLDETCKRHFVGFDVRREIEQVLHRVCGQPEA